jgi:hypothetical protein
VRYSRSNVRSSSIFLSRVLFSWLIEPRISVCLRAPSRPSDAASRESRVTVGDDEQRWEMTGAHRLEDPARRVIGHHDSGGELNLGFGHEPVKARYDVGGAASVERIGSQGDANLSHHGRGVQVVAHDVADGDVCRASDGTRLPGVPPGSRAVIGASSASAAS